MSGWVQSKCSSRSPTNWSVQGRQLKAILRASGQSTESLLDYVPQLTPRWERPEHLAPIALGFERVLHGTIRLLVSVPPQHGKTELIKHGLVWLLAQRPHLRNAYATYESHRAWRISRQTRELAERGGLQPDGAQEQWRVRGGGSLAAVGINGALTGEPVDGVLVIDDPHKNRKEAESPVRRQDVKDFLTSTAETRVHPGASIIIVHTRWHPDDLIGQCAKEDGWEVINLPAINDGTDPRRALGAALWEQHRPLAWLLDKQIRVGAYDWASLYQGQPRPRGGAVFGEPGDNGYYTALPTRYRCAYGVDLAYTSKTSACYSVALRLLYDGQYWYVHEVRRQQVDAPRFCQTLQAMQRSLPAPMLWHCATSEQGAGQFIRGKIGPRFRTELATVDKFQRALPVAAAWNAGRVLLPHPEKFPQSAEWFDAFLSEICNFTGVNDAQDDQVDALASAFIALQRRGPGKTEAHMEDRMA